MTFLEELQSRILVFDGAIGTMLIRAGLPEGHPPDAWCLERPDAVARLHAAYAHAGADVLTTNTFGANRLKLAKAGLEHQCSAINQAAVQLAREQAGDEHFVAGELGPTGTWLPPVGDADHDHLVVTFAEQAALLANAGVNLIIIETMYDLREGTAALEGAQKACDLPIVACLTFDRKSRGFFTVMGNPAAESMRALQEAGAVVVGANCSLGSGDMCDLAAEIRRAVRGPVIAQPNAGLPEIRDGKTVYPEDVATFTANVQKMIELGVNVVGGCCGTTPEYIAGLARMVREQRR
jgi:5-methyltetrahydrofolate--homocysteine methyltransferase